MAIAHVTIFDKKHIKSTGGKTNSIKDFVRYKVYSGDIINSVTVQFYSQPVTFSTSQGDSGGPLVCNKVAIGVISFNQPKKCDSSTLPNVYTNISKFMPWIIFGVKHKLN